MKKQNSRFRFRIWDNQNQQFIENSSSLHCYSNWAIDPFTGIVIDYVANIDGDHGDSFIKNPDPGFYFNKKLKSINKPKYVIQQFTGLKDSKKREIYEGDIIQVNTGKSYQNNYEVYWNECGFSMIDAKREGDKYGTYTKNLTLIDPDNPIIIGNIFENPELLK